MGYKLLSDILWLLLTLQFLLTRVCLGEIRSVQYTEVKQQDQQFEERFKTNDTVWIAKNTYMPRAFLLAPMSPIIRGKDDITTYFTKIKQSGVDRWTLDLIFVDSYAKVTVQVVHYDKKAANGNIKETGKSVVLFTTDPSSGTLKAAYDLWSTL